MWALSNGWVEDKDITHWMPIPSFDEILEANKDVLERIKEKGDLLWNKKEKSERYLNIMEKKLS